MKTQLELFPKTLPDEIAKRIAGCPHIVFSGIDIRQDEAGRYCLNDLHKAAGGENKKRPSLWLRSARTKALIAEFLSRNSCSENESTEHVFVLAEAGNPASNFEVPKHKNVLGSEPVSVAKPKTGSPSIYVIKPLVYAYAAWISPAFDRLVHEVFDAVISGLVEREARNGLVLDQIRPCLRKVAEATERGESRAVIGQSLAKSANAITYHRRQARRFGLLH